MTQGEEHRSTTRRTPLVCFQSPLRSIRRRITRSVFKVPPLLSHAFADVHTTFILYIVLFLYAASWRNKPYNKRNKIQADF